MWTMWSVEGQTCEPPRLSQFFTENADWLDEEEVAAGSSIDFDLEEVAEAVEGSLRTAAQLTDRLAEINREMVNYMVGLAHAKTTNR